MNSIRRPAAAGTFYRADPRALRAEVEDCFTNELGPGAIPVVNQDGPHRIRGLICPHAGYRYSGPAAAWCYSELARDGAPDIAVLIGPNHTGLGPAISVSNAAAWSTPLGDMPVDAAARTRLLDIFLEARADDDAHRGEHSLEVQVPFLQYLFGRTVPILPVTLGSVSPSAAASAEALGLPALAHALVEAVQGRRAVIIGSSDMTHFEPHDVAARNDQAVLDKALALDVGEMLRAVDAHRVSMCGMLAVATMIQAASLLGADEARLLTYYSSGDVTGDKREVVGYAAARLAAAS